MPPTVRLQSNHLYRSRHGIWYAQWVVPAALRALHPQLPREIKRSTQTAQKRVALAFARAFIEEYISKFTDLSTSMAQKFDSNDFDLPYVAFRIGGEAWDRES